MGYSYSFLDNTTYGTDDMNEKFALLSRDGVLPYVQSDTVAQDTNDMISENTEEGVLSSGNSMMVVSCGDGTVKVSKGAGIFETGATISVDDDGVELECIDGGTTYVYAEHNPELNYIGIFASATLPDGIILPLAEVSSDGSITDTRTFARSDFVPNSANQSRTISVMLNCRSDGVYEETAIDLDPNVYKYLILHRVDNNGRTYVALGHNCMEIKDSMSNMMIGETQTSSYTMRLYFRRSGRYLYVSSQSVINRHCTFELEVI